MIKIFISSTFSDMQSERDVIRKNVLPRLRQFSRKIGQDVSIVDLRWGISGEEMDSDAVMTKILSVCAEEIDSCQPYFVLLIGDRYGTSPEDIPLMSFLKKHPEISPELLKDKSITEIETILALQKKIGTSEMVACIRNSDLIDKIPHELKSVYVDVGKKAKLLTEFKENIRQNEWVDVIDYHAEWDAEKSSVCGLENFADKLIESLARQIKKNIGEMDCSPEAEAEIFDKIIIDNISKRYVPRDEYIDDVISFVNGNENVLILSGSSGTGKTYIMAKLAQILSEINDYKVISLFLGRGTYDFSLKSIFENLIHRLNSMVADPVFIEKTTSLHSLKAIAISLIKNITEKYKLIIFVDNVSALQLEEREHFFANFPLFNDGDTYKLVASINSSSSVATNALSGYTWRTLDVLGVNEEKMKQIVSNLLSEEGKELGRNSLNAFYNASLFRSPLYISLALKRLMLLSSVDFNNIHKLSSREGIDGGEALSAYLLQLIQTLPENESGIADLIIDLLAEEIGIKNHKLLIDLILIANEQLRAHDLVEIINTVTDEKINLLDLTNLVRNSEEIFTINSVNGKIQFTHDTFKLHFKQKMNQRDTKLHRAVFDYIDGLDIDDPVKNRLYFVFALYTEDYNKALSFVKLVNEHKIKNAYLELRPIFLSDDTSDIFLEYLIRLADFAANQGTEELNIIAYEYIGEIYHIINRSAFGRKSIDIEFLAPIYRLMKKHKDRVAKNSEYNRTLYMVAEKCGIASFSYEDSRQYYSDFLKYCFGYYESLDSSYKHRDFILSDLGYAYEKNAEIAVGDCMWDDAYRLYDLAIKTVSARVAPSTNKLDLLEYQKNYHIVQKYNILLYALQSDEKTLGSYRVHLLSELTSVIDFCEKTIKNFIQNERSMVLARYIALLMEANFALSKYHNIIHWYDKEKFYLEKSLKAAYEHYRACDDLLSLEQIRSIEHRLGLNTACDFSERMQYLEKANRKTLDLIQKLSDKNMIENMRQELDVINFQMMVAIFEHIHANINIKSQEFISNAAVVIAKDATLITDKNFDTVLLICKKYLIETEESKIPEMYSNNEERRKIETGIFDGMILTMQEVISYGSKKIQYDFANAYNYLNKNLTESQMRFKKIWDEYQDLFELVSLYISKYIDIYPNKYLFDNINKIAEIAEKTVHNLMVFAYEFQEKESKAFWEEQEAYMHASTKLCHSLRKVFNGEDFTYNQQEKTYAHRFTIPVTDMRLLAFCIKRGGVILKKYLEYTAGKEKKHWYNIYQELINANSEQVKKELHIVGKYLCDNFDDISVRRILYHSIFYESIALEYAYKNHRKDLAEKIVFNGYDHYLELSTLYILRHYDRGFYYSVFDNLKQICLLREIDQIDGNYYWRENYIRNIYGNVFCDEFIKLAKRSLEKLEHAGKDDPRMQEKRKTPNWAQENSSLNI